MGIISRKHEETDRPLSEEEQQSVALIIVICASTNTES